MRNILGSSGCIARTQFHESKQHCCPLNKPAADNRGERKQVLPILHSPGLMMPGQLGPMSLVFDCCRRACFTFTMSFWGMPSVMHTTRGISFCCAKEGQTKQRGKCALLALTLTLLLVVLVTLVGEWAEGRGTRPLRCGPKESSVSSRTAMLPTLTHPQPLLCTG